jgi:glycosyltransferase involved in cell wall biosynthesis
MSPRLRILLATAEAHPTHRADVRVLFGEALPRHGVDVDLLAVTPPGNLEAPWSGGRAFLHVAASRRAEMLGDLWQQCSLLWRCGGGYDALVVRDKPVLGAIGWLAARLWRIRFCYWMSYPMPQAYLTIAARDDGSVGGLRRIWLRTRGRLGQFLLDRLLVPRSDWLFVQTEAMERALRERGLAHDRVTPVPMGVDVDAVPAPARSLPDGLRGRPAAVYLGTLDRNRNPELLVDAARIVASRVPGFVMLVVGEADEPADRGWLRRYAEDTGAGEAVRFTGWLPYAEGLALARHAAVGISPIPRSPLTEVGSPTKAVEYLACGIPVVANDQPDQAHVLRSSGGGLVVPFSAEGFANGIVEVLRDAATWHERALRAREWVAGARSYRVLGALVAIRLRECVAGGSLADADGLRS